MKDIKENKFNNFYLTDLKEQETIDQVSPAAVRSHAAMMCGMSPGARLPDPTSVRVPTMMRTML